MDPARVTIGHSFGVFSICLLALLLAAQASGDDWPQYRGPQRDGVQHDQHDTNASEKHPRALGNPTIVWRRPFGEGFSAITVTGSALVTLSLADGREIAARYDAGTGREVWRRELGPGFEEPFGNGPRSTPSVVGDTVVALSSHGLLAALQLEDGDVLWQVDLPTTVGGKMPRFGYSPSPLVVDDRVLLEVGAGDKRSIAAFDRKTGKVQWTTSSDRLGYSSPVAMQIADELHLVFVTPTSVVGVSPAGNLRWRWPIPTGSAIDQPIAMPVAVGTDRIFVAHRGEGGSVLLQLPTDETEPSPSIVWESRQLLNHMSSSVHIDGYLFGFHNATFKCLDAATGHQIWAKRGLGKGSLIAWGQDLLVLSDEGQLVIVPATPKAYQETARLQILTGRAWTAPSLAAGKLYARNHQEMVCVDLVSDGSSLDLASSGVTVSDLPTSDLPTSDLPTSDLLTSPSGDQASARPEMSTADVDDVLAGHLDARGGVDVLASIHSLRIEGRYAESSVYSNFELWRQSPDRYRLERRRDDVLTLRAFDGTDAWWVNPDTSPKPAAMPTAEVANLMAEVEIFGPLVAGRVADQDKRHRIELIGGRESETGSTWELQLTRPGGATETWLLDRETYLASERISTLNAYGESWELHTHYSDYRSVGGLVLPHLIEMEFSSLHRLMRVKTVTINPEVEPTVFQRPAKTPTDDS